MANDVIGESLCDSYADCVADNEEYCDRRGSEDFVTRTFWRIGGDDSPMDDESAAELASSSSLQSMLSAIIEERNRDHHLSSCHEMPDDGAEELVLFSRNSFWTSIFVRYFLEVIDDALRDDMLFYVRKTRTKSKSKLQPDVEVYRRSSPSQPSLDDMEIDWEETVYLNLILQHFEYYVTCAVCSRTGEKELQILKKFTQRVYASPSRRKMDRKGTEEEITYPNIFFTIDNFEECMHCRVPSYHSETLHLSTELNARRRLRSTSMSTLVIPCTRQSTLGD